MKKLLLDTNVLRKLCHTKLHAEVRQWLLDWLTYGLESGQVEIAVSAAAEYELRRYYLWKIDKEDFRRKALGRLDEICGLLESRPIGNPTLRAAAQRWAEAMEGNYQTAPERDVDWDVIIAVQAQEMGAVVVTENTNHLRRHGADAEDWNNLPVPTANGE